MLNWNKKKGSVLLISLGILSLMAVYAITFFNVMSTERSSSENYVQQLNAQNVAKAGIERGKALLKVYTLFEDEKKNASRERGFDRPNEAWLSLPRWQEAGKTADTMLLEQYNGPFSFSSHQGTFQGQNYTASVGNTVQGGRDYYRLKVYDCSSMIHINALNKENTKRILNNLFGALNVGDNALATRLIDRRPGQGYRTKNQIRGVIRDIYGGDDVRTKDVFDKIRDYITCYAWLDHSQIQPFNAVAPTSAPTAFDGSRVIFDPRAPININTAPEAVLIAVIEGLQGGGTTINSGTAGQVANGIINRRRSNPFKTWNGFNTWADANFGGPIGDILKANFNPNVVLNKFYPDANLRRELDKTDLQVYSTEFCFNSMGYFEITSLGRIVSSDGSILAQAKVQSVTKIFHVHRDTTQNDFESDRRAINFRARHLGIISGPEFSNARRFGQSDGELELRPVNPLCSFDGQMHLNGLIRKNVLRGDFLMGFVRTQTLVTSLRMLMLPNNPPNVGGSTDNQAPGSAKARAINDDGTESLFTYGDKAKFFQGSDLFSLGVVCNDERKRFFKFNQNLIPRDRGTIEMWVRPEKDKSGPGDPFDPPKNECYFYWGPDSGQYNRANICIYRNTQGHIVAGFSLGWDYYGLSYLSGPQPRNWRTTNNVRAAAFNTTVGWRYQKIKYDFRSPTKGKQWKPGEWHHIRVTYGLFAANRFIRGRARGKRFQASEGRLFVDGDGAADVMPFGVSRTINTTVPVSYDTTGANGSSFYVGARPAGAGGRDFANAVIDNVFVHNYVEKYKGAFDRTTFLAYSRYYDQSFQSYNKKYMKRLYALEDQELTLGHVSWTVYPSNHELGGSQTAEGGAIVSIRAKGGELPLGPDTSGAGYLLSATAAGGVRPPLKLASDDNTPVYYLIDFDLDKDRSGDPHPILESPVFDDITITYYTTPETIVSYEVID